MRQLVKFPESQALHTISGNNSLITGAYRHALGLMLIFGYLVAKKMDRVGRKVRIKRSEAYSHSSSDWINKRAPVKRI